MHPIQHYEFYLKSLSKTLGSHSVSILCCDEFKNLHNVTPAELFNKKNQRRLLLFLFQNRNLLSD